MSKYVDEDGYRAHKGDYVVSKTVSNKVERWRLKRVVRARHDGYVTHVCLPSQYATAKVNSGTGVGFPYPESIFRIGPVARCRDLDLLGNAEWSSREEVRAELRHYKS